MIFNYQKWKGSLLADQEKYQKASPYPHIVFDDFLEEKAAEKTLAVFPKIKEEGWIHYVHVNEKKHGLNKLDLIPEYIRDGLIAELNSKKFIAYLEALTGISNLIPDTTIEGGGIHQSERGGYLNIHADFTVHPHKKTWRRRVNVLVYLNKGWEASYGGDLELWEKDMSACKVTIAPIFNRIAIFNTDEDSYHGFPEPITCPEGETRKSIALYYFTEEKPGAFKRRSTNYKARPDDGLKSVFIWLDKKMIALYSWLKGLLGINDDFISKVLHLFSRKKE
ncbi:2OG-Fe(II) oxygenase [Oceanihabitans sp. 2_MG-2023]|uniref:2OG-Fe(II) oxygenase n=1 Tax=Oceanihabitans sp. 2_MG-2023 TaxID=3062661 RepID=UPI0026E146CE|nr:2OG-Fe(II) oxygenase [Oceanihabitans sp. 2_MG-2023]MDO6596419.1 2OG-Fe(II) oxygenase [Oceanihabitans sp. 2_MG-2023]